MRIRAGLSSRLRQLEVAMSRGHAGTEVPGDYRAALAAGLQDVHERMAESGTLPGAARLNDVMPALRARLDAIARSAPSTGVSHRPLIRK